jgi:hypothetical protein
MNGRYRLAPAEDRRKRHAREFKSMILELAQHDHLPDYRVSLEARW